MLRPREVDSEDDNLYDLCQNSSVDTFFPQKCLAFSNK